jgi:hypothetical protein
LKAVKNIELSIPQCGTEHRVLEKEPEAWNWGLPGIVLDINLAT